MKTQPLTIAHLSALTAASSTTLSATELVDTLADYEGDVTLHVNNNTGTDVELISSFYASYLIALLLVDDLLVLWSTLLMDVLTSLATRNEARFLTHRFPSHISDTHTLQKVKGLLRATWSQDYASVYQISHQTQWPDILKPLVDRYLGMRLTGGSWFTIPCGTEELKQTRRLFSTQSVRPLGQSIHVRNPSYRQQVP